MSIKSLYALAAIDRRKFGTTNVAIEVGDLLSLDRPTGLVAPASEWAWNTDWLTTTKEFAAAFIGVACQSTPGGDNRPILVAVSERTLFRASVEAWAAQNAYNDQGLAVADNGDNTLCNQRLIAEEDEETWVARLCEDAPGTVIGEIIPRKVSIDRNVARNVVGTVGNVRQDGTYPGGNPLAAFSAEKLIAATRAGYTTTDIDWDATGDGDCVGIGLDGDEYGVFFATEEPYWYLNPFLRILKNGTQKAKINAGWSIEMDQSNGSNIGTNLDELIGFWGVTPVVQPRNAAQAAITNSTGGSQDGTLQSCGDTTASDQSALINDNFTDVDFLLGAIRDALVQAGIMKGAA